MHPFWTSNRTTARLAAMIKPGSYPKIREEGLVAFHARIREASPVLYDRAVATLDDWKKIAFLHVEGSRLDAWHIPGLLLIGDAAHVMTPIGGVGINYAIWDAVETANVLVLVLKSGAAIESVHLSTAESSAHRARAGGNRQWKAELALCPGLLCGR